MRVDVLASLSRDRDKWHDVGDVGLTAAHARRTISMLVRRGMAEQRCVAGRRSQIRITPRGEAVVIAGMRMPERGGGRPPRDTTRLLELLPATRSELERSLGWHRRAAQRAIRRLVDDGAIVEVDRRPGRGSPIVYGRSA